MENKRLRVPEPFGILKKLWKFIAAGIFFLFLTVLPTIATAQAQKTVSGKVSDNTGVPLPGVSVVIKGTTNGSITDAQGNYTLQNVPSDATLTFSFVGMQSQDVAIGQRSVLNVTLEETSIGIEEV
ncbi:MAG: carboxypeptidase-like regulatory domain-containing protein, partial [Methylococcaceae bacterium]